MAEGAVTVKFFASLREAVGCAEVEVQAASLEQLKQALAAVLPADGMAELLAENVKIAVNQDIVEAADHELAPGDEVAFLPPVTGG